MTEPAQLPEARRAEALKKIEEREKGIRANGIKQGYGDRDKEWYAKLGVTSMDEAREVTELRKRPTLTEERKHGAHKFWQGIGTGALAALVVTSLVFVLIIRQMTHMAFEEAQQATQQGALVGAAAANQDPRSQERTVPHLDNP